MNILLTNDDGIHSEGLQLMCKTLSQLDGVNVYVVAPDSQRSAFSHAINFHKSVKFLPVSDYFGAVMAFASEGTPADCVKFADKNLNWISILLFPDQTTEKITGTTFCIRVL